MHEMIGDKFLKYNSQGIVPGPGETAEAFLARAEYCLHIAEKLGAKLPFSAETEAPPQTKEAACRETALLYDIFPSWVPVFFSNYQLAPWHGGCAWIFQLSDNEPTTAFFQLRQAFKHSKRYLGLYERDELIAHELVHVGRMMFEEPRFEEVLAYRTANSRWRRWWGPIVQSSAESAWFVFLLLPLVFLDIFLLASGYEKYYWGVMWLKLLPAFFIVAAAVRLYLRQRTFARALQTLASLTHDLTKARAVIFRLTDSEIELFAGMNTAEIGKYAQAQECFRWSVIRAAYLHTN